MTGRAKAPAVRAESKVSWKSLLSVALLLLLVFAGSALALGEEARDITSKCTLSTKCRKEQLKRVRDGNYASWYKGGKGEKAAITVTLPEGQEAGGFYIKWANTTPPIYVQAKVGKTFETVTEWDTEYLCDFIPLPEGVRTFRFFTMENAKDPMYISELRVFTRGELPSDVQRWDPPLEKAELMVLTTHPDDELIFLGGLLPYYVGELHRKVQVVCVVPTMAERRLEFLDGLWHCGLRNYPVIGRFSDRYSVKMNVIHNSWGKNRIESFVTRQYRRFQPEVVVTQDTHGEYGHGAHKAVSDAAQKALSLAADEGYRLIGDNPYSPWQVKKLYIHLYPDNQLRMDWLRPLEAFGGKTALEVATEAFQMHISQQKDKYVVEDGGPYDNALFGLYYSEVGEDEARDDFLEHI